MLNLLKIFLKYYNLSINILKYSKLLILILTILFLLMIFNNINLILFFNFFFNIQKKVYNIIQYIKQKNKYNIKN